MTPHQQLENLLVDARREFLAKHRELLLEAIPEARFIPEENLSFIVLTSFLGSAIESLYLTVGAESSRALLDQLISNIATAQETINAAKTRGVELDPLQVVRDILNSTPS